MTRIDKWEAGKGITQRKRNWTVRSIPVVVAIFVLSGIVMFTQQSPEPVSAHSSCVSRTFRQRSARDPYHCVPHIQTMLNNLMVNGRFADLDVDGYFGPRTARAVRNFQSWERIGVDGIVGPQTWDRLCDPEYATTRNTTHWSNWYNAAKAAGCNI